MTEQEMFEKSFQRPTDYFKLSSKDQWEIDNRLGILDWNGEGLKKEDMNRFNKHYKQNQYCDRRIKNEYRKVVRF